MLWGIAVLQAVFLAIWLAASGDPDGVELDALALFSACAMGGQTALTRSWHTGVMTTYVSGSLVSLLGAVASRESSDPEWRNQIGVIVALFIGALTRDHRAGSRGEPGVSAPASRHMNQFGTPSTSASSITSKPKRL